MIAAYTCPHQCAREKANLQSLLQMLFNGHATKDADLHGFDFRSCVQRRWHEGNGSTGGPSPRKTSTGRKGLLFQDGATTRSTPRLAAGKSPNSCVLTHLPSKPPQTLGLSPSIMFL